MLRFSTDPKIRFDHRSGRAWLTSTLANFDESAFRSALGDPELESWLLERFTSSLYPSFVLDGQHAIGGRAPVQTRTPPPYWRVDVGASDPVANGWEGLVNILPRLGISVVSGSLEDAYLGVWDITTTYPNVYHDTELRSVSVPGDVLGIYVWGFNNPDLTVVLDTTKVVLRRGDRAIGPGMLQHVRREGSGSTGARKIAYLPARVRDTVAYLVGSASSRESVRGPRPYPSSGADHWKSSWDFMDNVARCLEQGGRAIRIAGQTLSIPEESRVFGWPSDITLVRYPDHDLVTIRNDLMRTGLTRIANRIEEETPTIGDEFANKASTLKVYDNPIHPPSDFIRDTDMSAYRNESDLLNSDLLVYDSRSYTWKQVRDRIRNLKPQRNFGTVARPFLSGNGSASIVVDGPSIRIQHSSDVSILDTDRTELFTLAAAGVAMDIPSMLATVATIADDGIRVVWESVLHQVSALPYFTLEGSGWDWVHSWGSSEQATYARGLVTFHMLSTDYKAADAMYEDE